MIVALPFAHPVIDAYSGTSGRIAIASCHPECKLWLVAEHVRLVYDKAINSLLFDKLENAVKKVLGENFVEVPPDILWNGEVCDYFVECLISGNYTFAVVDHYEIEATDKYRQSHFVHDHSLVYGCDSNLRVLYVADNFFFGKYMSAEIPFKQFRSGLRSAYAVSFVEATRRPHAFSFSFSPPSYRIDRDEIAVRLNDLMRGSYTSGVDGSVEYSNERSIYGIDLYPFLVDYLLRIRDGVAPYDHRALHVLWNHKSVILELVRYLSRTNLIDGKVANRLAEKWEALRQECLISRNLLLKYRLTKNNATTDSIVRRLNHIWITERAALEAFLAGLK